MNEQMRLISYLLYGLFIMDLGLQSIETNNWSVDNFEKHVTSMSCTLEPAILSGHTGQQIPFFDSCQLTITWMSIRMCSIKLNIDCICLGHLASNAQPLQENSQSECTYYCSHIIKGFSIY